MSYKYIKYKIKTTPRKNSNYATDYYVVYIYQSVTSTVVFFFIIDFYILNFVHKKCTFHLKSQINSDKKDKYIKQDL